MIRSLRKSYQSAFQNVVNWKDFRLTAHGITRKWERKRYLLNVREFPGHHYGPLVKAMVDDLLKEWGIDEARVHCVVHDEGSNMEEVSTDT